MTLPAERYRAITLTREFLRRLLDPSATPRVPKNIRKEAYWCLRHYPTPLDQDRMAANKPDTLAPIYKAGIEATAKIINKYDKELAEYDQRMDRVLLKLHEIKGLLEHTLSDGFCKDEYKYLLDANLAMVREALKELE